MLKKEIHIRLRAARKAAGFKSAYDFADLIGVPRTTYSQHERGDRNIKDDYLEMYAKNLKVNEAWLRNGKGAAFLNPDSEKINTLSNELKANDIYKQLNTHDSQILDKELLIAITSLLFEKIQNENLTVSPNIFANTITEIYCSIASTTEDVHQRLMMVPAVIKPYLKSFN